MLLPRAVTNLSFWFTMTNGYLLNCVGSNPNGPPDIFIHLKNPLKFWWAVCLHFEWNYCIIGRISSNVQCKIIQNEDTRLTKISNFGEPCVSILNEFPVYLAVFRQIYSVKSFKMKTHGSPKLDTRLTKHTAHQDTRLTKNYTRLTKTHGSPRFFGKKIGEPCVLVSRVTHDHWVCKDIFPPQVLPTKRILTNSG